MRYTYHIYVKRTTCNMYHGEFPPWDKLRQKFVEKCECKRKKERERDRAAEVCSFLFYLLPCAIFIAYVSIKSPFIVSRDIVIESMLLLLVFSLICKLAPRLLVRSSRTVFWTKSFDLPVFLHSILLARLMLLILFSHHSSVVLLKMHSIYMDIFFNAAVWPGLLWHKHTLTQLDYDLILLAYSAIAIQKRHTRKMA